MYTSILSAVTQKWTSFGTFLSCVSGECHTRLWRASELGQIQDTDDAIIFKKIKYLFSFAWKLSINTHCSHILQKKKALEKWSYLLLEANIALSPWIGYWSGPTRNVTSQRSGTDRIYFKSSHSAYLSFKTITSASCSLKQQVYDNTWQQLSRNYIVWMVMHVLMHL